MRNITCARPKACPKAPPRGHTARQLFSVNSREGPDREAQRRGILCNVVDVPEYCDFYYPAVVRRGDLQIAVSTSGQSPSLAQKIRQQLERQFDPGYARWVADLGATRKLVLASALDPQRKRELLQSLASREALEAALAEESAKRFAKGVDKRAPLNDRRVTA